MTGILSCRAHAIDSFWAYKNAEGVTEGAPAPAATTADPGVAWRIASHPEGARGPCAYCSAPSYFLIGD